MTPRRRHFLPGNGQTFKSPNRLPVRGVSIPVIGGLLQNDGRVSLKMGEPSKGTLSRVASPLVFLDMNTHPQSVKHGVFFELVPSSGCFEREDGKPLVGGSPIVTDIYIYMYIYIYIFGGRRSRKHLTSLAQRVSCYLGMWSKCDIGVSEKGPPPN